MNTPNAVDRTRQRGQSSIGKRYPVYRSEITHFAFGAVLIYALISLFSSNRPLSEGEIIAITALGAASFAITARIFSTIDELVLRSSQIRDSMDYMKQWLPPAPIASGVPPTAAIVGNVFVASLIAVSLYALDGIKLAVLPTLVVAAAAFFFYLLLAGIFWFRLWRHLLTKPPLTAPSQPRRAKTDYLRDAVLALPSIRAIVSG